MNIINKLTLRHLKQNKRRTLVTIFGVIISVAMLTAVATLGVSFMDLMKRQAIVTEGEWHVQYKDVNLAQIEAIKEDDATKELIISDDRGYAKLEGSENKNKPYLFIKQYNEKGLTNFPIELSEGRLPKAKNEIVLSEEILNNTSVSYEIGEQLTLEVGDRYYGDEEKKLTQIDPLQDGLEEGVRETIENKTSETYTIVGLIERPTWESTWSPGYTMISYLEESELTSSSAVNGVVVLNKVNRSIYDHAQEVADQNNIKNINYNTELLRYYGLSNDDNLQLTLYSLVGIIMAVIIVGSVSLIYNAFAISVSERSRHLGMLSSVGATKKQKRNSVFFEGAVIGLISIPLGIFAGLVGMMVTFAFINTFLEGALNVSGKLQVVVTPSSLLVAVGVSILTIFISTYLPARKASKISAIDAIRQAQDVKLSKKAVKTPKIVRKIFGVEAEIGLKNLKRNKRRYQATVFSLVISIVLFLSVSFFTTNLEKSVELSQDSINYDITVGGGNLDEEKIALLTGLDYVTESSSIKELYLNAWIDQSALPEILQKEVDENNSILKDGKYPYNIELKGLDEKTFQSYLEKIGGEIEEFTDTANPTAIVVNKIIYQEINTGKIIEADAINTEIGETIDLHQMDYETEEEEFIKGVKIGAITEELPMGVSLVGNGVLSMIVPKDMIDYLIGEQIENDAVSQSVFINSSDPIATQAAIEEVGSDLYVYNVYQSQQQNKQMILLLSVFIYGFISLISLISIANIFNTISTSISLRKREFAMMKSVGMTPKGFNKMIHFESIFYGIKALLYGLPISVAIMFLIHRSTQQSFEYEFTLPWLDIVIVTVAIFIIVGSAMLYAISKVKKENIIDGLKQENI
ncbi:ABC transporter permease [Paraliobacillus sediminis]|uniref:ABC transporter permease n=1 Tax=Paraliobacillus sediminis TaxID=1885916 RepID=UPI000E3BEE41|nr:ABC transporter permease [Paraliobacillus sediminis]